MQIEYLLYFYMFISILMLLFHLLFVVKERNANRGIQKKSKHDRLLIQRQMKNLKQGKAIERAHETYLKRQLKRVNSLIAYQNALQSLMKQDPQQTMQYLELYSESFVAVAQVYEKRDSMQKAYYAYIIRSFYIPKDNQYGNISEILFSYFIHSTIYCRENVLQAFYHFGNIDVVEHALQYLNDQQLFHHEKLLSDGLASFQGHKEELAQRLWKHYATWDEMMVVAIVNFIRFTRLDFQETFYEVLQDTKTSFEVRLAIIRYFKTITYAPVGNYLCSVVMDHTHNSIMRNTACAALDSYPSKATFSVLKWAMCDADWYVRKNAATSFLHLNPSDGDIQSILDGKDAFARDMLKYQMKVKEEAL